MNDSRGAVEAQEAAANAAVTPENGTTTEALEPRDAQVSGADVDAVRLGQGTQGDMFDAPLDQSPAFAPDSLDRVGHPSVHGVLVC